MQKSLKKFLKHSSRQRVKQLLSLQTQPIYTTPPTFALHHKIIMINYAKQQISTQMCKLRGDNS